MAVEGKNTGKIARILNADGAPMPGQLIGAPSKVKEEFIEWDGHMVRRILDNETYTGVLIQGRQQTLVPGKKMKKAGTKVFRHEGHHPAIVSHEAWEKVQKKGETHNTVQGYRLAAEGQGQMRCVQQGPQQVGKRDAPMQAEGMRSCGQRRKA